MSCPKRAQRHLNSIGKARSFGDEYPLTRWMKQGTFLRHIDSSQRLGCRAELYLAQERSVEILSLWYNLLCGRGDENREPYRFLDIANPPRYFLVITRGLFLKGAGAEILWPQVLALGGLGSMVLTLSTLRFSERFE